MNEHLTIGDIERIADGESQPPAHVRECARCAAAVLDAMQLKRAVRDAMRGDPAPASLRRSVRRRPSPMTWLAAAAAIVAIVAGALLIARQRQPGALAELADMHATLLASANPVDVVSTDKHTVKPWFESRLPFAVPVPDLEPPFRLIGGRVVYWRGQQMAYLLIGKGAHRISVFVSPRPIGGTEPPNVSTLTWDSGGLHCVAIGDVPESDLVQLQSVWERL